MLKKTFGRCSIIAVMKMMAILCMSQRFENFFWEEYVFAKYCSFNRSEQEFHILSGGFLAISELWRKCLLTFGNLAQHFQLEKSFQNSECVARI